MFSWFFEMDLKTSFCKFDKSLNWTEKFFGETFVFWKLSFQLMVFFAMLSLDRHKKAKYLYF